VGFSLLWPDKLKWWLTRLKGLLNRGFEPKMSIRDDELNALKT
jgi:hypothetical protein